MAAVEITISGVLYDKLDRTTKPVVLIGEASLTGLGVGDGPIVPPEQPPGEGKPPGIWGPTDPRPGNPISGIPGLPGYEPPGNPPEITNPPVAWKAIWTPSEGWVAVGVVNPELPHPTPSGAQPPPKK